MKYMRKAKGKETAILFTDGTEREVRNGNVYLYENGMLRIVADGKDEYYLPHTVHQVIFPDVEEQENAKRPKVMLG